MGKRKRKGKIKFSTKAKLASIRGRNNAGNVGRTSLLNNSGTILRLKVKPKQV